MDKYEYRIKADQIRKLVNEGNFEAAMKLADTIDWRRVKNVSMLCTVSDIYEKNGKYEESHELLLMAYDRSPIGRMMVYKLAELAIKMEDYEEAIDYYREFVHLSPGDIAADILKYKIYKAKGASAEELIPIMEAFKEREYHEEWAYELAHLYHEAGMGSRCIEECDEIILWFSEGKYVEKAMELKMLYRPLTPEQQEKYEHRNDVKEEETGFFDEDEEDESALLDTSRLEVITEEMFSEEVDPDDIKIKPVNLGKYDTINLQAELAKSMEQIMSATEKEAVDTTMENIRRLVEDSQILDLKFDEELEKNEIVPETLQVEMPGEMEISKDAPDEKVSFDRILAQENDGQISLYMPEANILEKQITGQMKIEDVLNEWEKMKSAAEVAIKEAELKRLNETKGKALQKAENIMAKLALIISEEEMKANGDEIVAALEASFLEEDEALAQVAATLENEPDDLSARDIGLEEIDLDGISLSNEDIAEINLDEVSQSEVDLNQADLADVNLEEASQSEADLNEDASIETATDLASDQDFDLDEVGLDEQTLAELELAQEENEASLNIAEQSDQPVLDEAEDDDNAAAAIEERITSSLPKNLQAMIEDELESEEEDSRQADESKKSQAGGLTKSQQELFAAFLSVRGVEKSLNKIFAPMNAASEEGIPFEAGNIALIGNEQTGKTTLGMAIAKGVQMAQNKKSAKVAKISANSLNTKDMKLLTDKMEGGVLIIEKAGNLTEKAIKNIMSAIREANEEIMLILEDTKAGIEGVLGRDKDFANQITYRIELPEYNNDELVEFGKEYAKTLMYAIDDMAILALYTCLGNIQKDEEALTIEQVKDIIDKAIAQNNKKKFKRLKDVIMKRRYDEEKRVILQESDFEDII